MKFTIVESRLTDLQAKYPGFEKVIQRFADADPTPQKKYLNWMVNHFMKYKKDFYSVSDFYIVVDFVERIEKVVQHFDKLQNVLPADKRDISQWNDESSIENLQRYLDEVQGRQDEKDVHTTASKNKDVIYHDESVTILIPNTWEASKKYGANTQWCTTASDSDHYYNKYMREGWLYYALFSDPNAAFPKLAINVGTRGGIYQVYDPRDVMIAKNKDLRHTNLFSAEASKAVMNHFESNREVIKLTEAEELCVRALTSYLEVDGDVNGDVNADEINIEESHGSMLRLSYNGYTFKVGEEHAATDDLRDYINDIIEDGMIDLDEEEKAEYMSEYCVFEHIIEVYENDREHYLELAEERIMEDYDEEEHGSEEDYLEKYLEDKVEEMIDNAIANAKSNWYEWAIEMGFVDGCFEPDVYKDYMREFHIDADGFSLMGEYEEILVEGEYFIVIRED